MPTIYRRKSHCVFACDYHLVFPTKYRRKLLTEGVLAYLKTQIEAIKEHYPNLIFK
jgi:REP element-mobilizing transposase RayT